MTETYEKLRRPPKDALKEIGAGRLKGKSNIDPQWRLEIMNEVFGDMGEAWGYTIDKLWTEATGTGEIAAFALVTVWVKDKLNVSPGIGGSMLVVQEKAGLHTDDDCYKKAVTDALSVALKPFGVAADIYRGLWDGSKYVDEKHPEEKTEADKAFDSLLDLAKKERIGEYTLLWNTSQDKRLAYKNIRESIFLDYVESMAPDDASHFNTIWYSCEKMQEYIDIIIEVKNATKN